jgi:long-chain acyl-CoA synthetase
MTRTPTDDFFAAMQRHAAHVALNDGAVRQTYGELLRDVDAWADRLHRLGARRVAYRLPNGRAWIALDLALLKTGRVAVPIPDFFSSRQERHVLAASGVDTYVVASDHTAPAGSGFTSAVKFGAQQAFRGGAARPVPVHATTAKITFTSGTTGTPKGVCLSAAHLLATAAAIADALGGAPAWRHACTLPLSLLLENVAGVYANLSAGHEVCAAPLDEMGISGSSGLNVAAFVAAQLKYRPDSIILVPQLLLALTAAAEFGVTVPATYRFVAVGGASVARSLIERARRVGIPAYEGYGLTECGSVVALNLPNADRVGSVGKPLAHAAIDVRGGEIHVRGATMLGYLGDRAAPDDIATGDMGAFDDAGHLYVSGRRRNNFITAFGRNVSPEWIEGELQSEFAIATAAVFGESLPHNVALIVPRGQCSDAAVATAVAAANARLPDYARIATWRTVAMADFAAAGCLTENARPRRDAIVGHYHDVISAMAATLQENFDASVRSA